MSNNLKSFSQLSRSFVQYFGPNAINDLCITSSIPKNLNNTRTTSTFNSNNGHHQKQQQLPPMILIAGQQLTGKSTMANKLSKYYNGGQFYSVGGMFREFASQLGISVGEQSRLLRLVQEGDESKNDFKNALHLLGGRRIDLELDYKTCKIISDINSTGNNNTKFSVIEGRQPALMGTFMQSLGRENLIKVYVTCSAREKAIRFLQREIGQEYAKIADQQIDKNLGLDPSTPLSTLTNAISKLPLPNIDKVLDDFLKNQFRDEDDRKRY
eukprot:gene8424-10343_t